MPRVKEIEAEQIKIQPIINSKYDSSIPYILHSKHSEWAPIGLLSQLFFQGDETCWAGGYCKNGDNGLATLSLTRGWRVMERLDENHIKILFK